MFNSRSRNHARITGVTIKMLIKLLAMPPMTGVASGFITSAPVRVLHMMGEQAGTMASV
ncbi:MAG TPA: hypothetical protein VGW39_09940 [Chthoniobacterales bacterium]|nr:hypothetical protein [Chthoniobacterales bacterium]